MVNILNKKQINFPWKLRVFFAKKTGKNLCIHLVVPHCSRADYIHTDTHTLYTLAYMILRFTTQLPLSDNTSEQHSRTNVHMTISVSRQLGPVRATAWVYMVSAPHLHFCIRAVRRVHSTFTSWIPRTNTQVGSRAETARQHHGDGDIPASETGVYNCRSR
jgi:hypothetical protein